MINRCKSSIIIFLSLIISFAVSCNKDDMTETIKESPSITIDESKVEPGIIRIKVTEEYSSLFEEASKSNNVSTKVGEIDDIMRELGAISIKRTFPYSGKYEARTRAAGLHLWYDVVFNPLKSLTKAANDFSSVKGIVFIEPINKIELVDNYSYYEDLGPVYSHPLKTSSGILENEGTKYPFNDEYLPYQWSYFNSGTIDGVNNVIAGADINLFDAWKYYSTGNPDVIVGIIDGGIDFNHEDLADNMWINYAELNGEEGVDDDNNGYVDDVYGYNFVNNSGELEVIAHATHIAGTIGAVNNNNKGVCGIAGGDGVNKGVRLMSCQIYNLIKDGAIPEAIKYAADNGAVIINNSWGYKDSSVGLREVDKEAIDYFIKNAGFDENGVQTGPMAGGVVIFSTGNDNTSSMWPAMYDKVISVASIAPNFNKAYYSNYGDWVTISAPGGDKSCGSINAEICSTAPDNKYMYDQGTSMATPHVVGVAALIVSKFGKKGFSPNEVWDRIINSAVKIDTINNSYSGKLGYGLVNAAAALSSSNSLPPNKIDKLSVNCLSNNAVISFTIPSDPDDGKAAFCKIYYADFDISGLNTNNIPSNVKCKEFDLRLSNYKAGGIYNAKIVLPEFNKKYYFVAAVLDYGRSSSGLSSQVNCESGSNNPPTINALDGNNISIKYHETKRLRFNLSDLDEHNLIWNISGDTMGIESDPQNSEVKNNTILTLTISGHAVNQATNKTLEPGNYAIQLFLSDIYGAKTSAQISYTILENNPPVVKKNPNNVYFAEDLSIIPMNISDYIVDPDGESLSYHCSSSNTNVVNVFVEGDTLMISPMKNNLGTSNVSLTATDLKGESVTINFKVLIRDPSKLVDIYPNPVVDKLYIRTGKQEEIDVKIYSISGAEVFSKKINIDPFNVEPIDMTKFSGGVYSLQITTKSGSITERIVKL